jgi:pyrroline-5-carboxylate reductase
MLWRQIATKSVLVTNSILNLKLGVIGGGVMAEAILSRLLTEHIFLPSQLLVSEPDELRSRFWADRYSIQATADNTAVAANCEVLLLATKPQALNQVAADLALLSHSARPSLMLSILAGVPLAKLQTLLPGIPVVRAMPNTPATVGAGITAIACSEQVSPEQKSQAEAIFGAVGDVLEIPETLMNAVTGLSGSGPGYVAVMIEALIDGGVAVGLSRQVATRLAIQTVLGTAQLLQTSGMHPAQLKDQVTSPGGTTIAGIAALEQAGIRAALINAVKAACDRSQALGG